MCSLKESVLDPLCRADQPSGDELLSMRTMIPMLHYTCFGASKGNTVIV